MLVSGFTYDGVRDDRVVVFTVRPGRGRAGAFGTPRRPEGSCSLRCSTQERGSLATTSRAYKLATRWVSVSACSRIKSQKAVRRQANRSATGDFEDAAPDCSFVPLGSGRFSAEQRGGAVKQQCQSTAKGRFASVRSANIASSAGRASAARRRRSSGGNSSSFVKKDGSIRPSRAIGAATRNTPTLKTASNAQRRGVSAAATAQRDAVARWSQKRDVKKSTAIRPPRPRRRRDQKKHTPQNKKQRRLPR